ncbi:MAG TPA: UDP-N-acetylglucosamine--N-acetylmuramyl-(pentapeptide) pyrophosphoryl-undecaprenol N-acetylglucosamine transferase [Phycisphaerae bacterium]|nr:UDP-N-acetylglucosamine--N-acetylmuramyl-(pentapeptide) pyrophosphoryl-undecaprenol N-acetylglucosamine transferase [Phycisphaerae bacterium]
MKLNTALSASPADAADSSRFISASGSAHFIFSGGGTGGHLYPGIAVAEELQNHYGHALKITWAATDRPIDRHLLSGFGDDYVRQPVQPVSARPLQWLGFYNAWRKSCAHWAAFFTSHRVDAVLALGGYAAAPAAYVGVKRGIPVGLLNPDALPGRANRFLLHRVTRVFSQWPIDALPASTQQVTGCPIRAALRKLPTRDQAINRLSLNPNRSVLVVTGASLGARTVNEALVKLLANPEFLSVLSQPVDGRVGWQILHLAGKDQGPQLRKLDIYRSGLPWVVLDYCDDMAAVWAAADLAISRSGAGACAEITACGVPAVLMPYPFHRDRHQQVNAARLCEHGAAVMVIDVDHADKNAAELLGILRRLMHNTSVRQSMALAAKAIGHSDAASMVANWLVSQVKLSSVVQH